MNQKLELWKIIVLLLGFSIGVFSVLESKESAAQKESQLISRIYQLEKQMDMLLIEF